nr:unnamed protein product [Callosobruchus analis]
MKTIMAHMKNRIRAAENMSGAGGQLSVFPLFIQETLRDTEFKWEEKMVQCDFEVLQAHYSFTNNNICTVSKNESKCEVRDERYAMPPSRFCKMEWTNNLTLGFLSLFGKEPVIWSPRIPDHKSRNKMANAWTNIQKQFSVECSVAELKKKRGAHDVTVLNLKLNTEL